MSLLRGSGVRWVCLTVLCCTGALRPGVAAADVKLPALFSDHMVLQRGVAAPVWGWADPGEEVTVSLAGQAKKATAGADGRWQVRLDPLAEGEALTLSVAGKNTLTATDVLVGEVWLGSGQSNMAMTVQRARDFEQEKAAANLPRLRMFTVRSGPAPEAQSECAGQWVVCTPEMVGGFSATAYFFGRELYKTLGVPIGLINSSVGGTPIESWVSLEAQAAKPELKPTLDTWEARVAAPFDAAKAEERFREALAKWQEAAKKAREEGKPVPRRPQRAVEPRLHQSRPGNLFNGKIAPLVPYAIRGAIWYQGESNTGTDIAALYDVQLPLLVQDWRKRWGQGDFPVAWVQLPNFVAAGRDWPRVREAMLKSLAVPNTGMAITMDVGDPKDIHPANKQEVGRRLSLWALAQVYGRKIAFSGPLPAGHRVAGGEIRVTFRHADGGLAAKGEVLKGFAIAGADKEWKPAQARIDGDTVILSSPEVKEPVAARYAWENDPECNLFNGAGLPASPFRTDDWE